MIIVIIAKQYTKKKEVERSEKFLIAPHSVQITSYLLNFILFEMIFHSATISILSIESVWAMNVLIYAPLNSLEYIGIFFFYDKYAIEVTVKHEYLCGSFNVQEVDVFFLCCLRCYCCCCSCHWFCYILYIWRLVLAH